MNSKERHEARYQRRKQQREQKKIAHAQQYGDFDKVFTFDNLYTSAHKCYLGANRFDCHLQRFYRKHGLNGYVLVFDFSKYFDSIPHEPLKGIVDSRFADKRIANLVKQFIDDFGDIGIGLGSQYPKYALLCIQTNSTITLKRFCILKDTGVIWTTGT